MSDGKLVELKDTSKFARRMTARDKCPKCGGELDTGFECNDCGFDALPFLTPEGYPV